MEAGGRLGDGDHGRRELPKPIGGLPPDLVHPPAGCRFAPRCVHAVAACADAAGLTLAERIAMPANNLLLVFDRR